MAWVCPPHEKNDGSSRREGSIEMKGEALFKRGRRQYETLQCRRRKEVVRFLLREGKVLRRSKKMKILELKAPVAKGRECRGEKEVREGCKGEN